MSLAVKAALLGGQACHSVIVLGLSSYVAHENNHSLVAPSINFLLFTSSFSIVALLFLEVAPRISQKAPPPYAILVVQALVSLLYMTGFIALSVLLSRLSFCNGSICNAARVDAIFAAFSYAVWAASATISGIEITKSSKRSDVKEGVEEKVRV